MKEIELPDFNDMFALVRKIKELTFEKMKLDLQLDYMKADITLVATNDPKYFQKDKAPSMSFLESTYLTTGFEGELIPIKTRLVEIVSDLEEAKMTMQVYRDIISLYQTESANMRAATMV